MIGSKDELRISRSRARLDQMWREMEERLPRIEELSFHRGPLNEKNTAFASMLAALVMAEISSRRIKRSEEVTS